jgi:hypothetical protein
MAKQSRQARVFIGPITGAVFALVLTACSTSGGGSVAGPGGSSPCQGSYSWSSSDQHVDLTGLPNLAENNTNMSVTPNADGGCKIETDPNEGSCIYLSDGLQVVAQNGQVTINDQGGGAFASGRATGTQLDLTWQTYNAGSRSVVFQFSGC